MDFKSFSSAVAAQFQSIKPTGLFRVAVNGDELWRIYLESFPEGANPIFQKRTEHDCSCCRSFVKALGGVVSIAGGKIVTIWDVAVSAEYQPVVDALAAAVRRQPIENIFLHTEPTVGTANSRQLLEDKTVRTWDHFFVNLPREVVVKGEQIGPKLADARATHDVMKRGLEGVTLDSIDMVLELIAQNSLYRGEEHRHAVSEFRKLLTAFRLRDLSDDAGDLFVWANLQAAAGRIRNTVMGTLLVDLSEGVDLDVAVRSFETKVAPTNYKRPTALVTKAMIEKAQQTVNELGYASALERRFATIEDITINNILFADRSARKAMNVFDQMAAAAPVNMKSLDRVEEVSVEDFITKILPRADSLEVLFENAHLPNLVSLIAPSDPTANCMFKWSNRFSWSYAGELADSIKERVKRAGGNVTGDFRASLSWHNYDDLDLHLIEPSGEEVYYGHPVSRHGGNLDVDMNAGAGRSRTPVENIVYERRGQMAEGLYQVSVKNFCQRETADVGFEVEMEFGGCVYQFAYPKAVVNQQRIPACSFNYTHKGGLQIVSSLPMTQASKTAWNLTTQAFHRVQVLMLSPNCWDDRTVGNKHYFFMLDGCRNDGQARGFFNEFLSSALEPHRKVLEVVGSKMRTDTSDRQLSGLGFSSTQRNQVVCRVGGSFSRVIRILV